MNQLIVTKGGDGPDFRIKIVPEDLILSGSDRSLILFFEILDGPGPYLESYQIQLRRDFEANACFFYFGQPNLKSEFTSAEHKNK